MTYSKGFLEDEEGQDLVEYGMLLSVVVIVVLAIIITLGADISLFYASMDSHLKDAPK